MASALLLLLTAAMPAQSDAADHGALLPAEALVMIVDERAPHLMPSTGERSKKQIWFLEKSRRPEVHVVDADFEQKHARAKPPARVAGGPNVQAELRLAEPMQPVGTRVEIVTTLYNLWNHEAMPLLAGQPYKRRFQLFLRDHYTKESTQADARLVGVLAAAATRFRAARVEVVSGYRSPKYNLMLRKKGHQVARESQHMQGTAVDFRIWGVATEALREFVRSLRLGGVGYYPRTRFIHADTGKVRYWQGS